MGHAVGEVERVYRSELREERARSTRRRVLASAGDAFLAHGYAGSTIRSIAAGAGVSVPTVELLFGTKAGVLKAAIDVAIAGDDEPVPMLERAWAEQARRAGSVADLLAVVVGVLGPSQERAAGLVTAVLEGAATSPDLVGLRDQLIVQRERTAAWLVERITALAPLRPELTRRDAVETVWLLMDAAVFLRLTRDRGWSLEHYQDWVSRSIRHLLLPDPGRHDSRRRSP